MALCDTALLLELLIPYVLFFFRFLFVAGRTTTATTTTRTCLTDMGHKDTHITLLLYQKAYTLPTHTHKHKVHPDEDTHTRTHERTVDRDLSAV